MTAPPTPATTPHLTIAAGSGVTTGSLLTRARALEAEARDVTPVLAAAYRRRATELRFEAWLRAVRLSPTADIEQFASLAA